MPPILTNQLVIPAGFCQITWHFTQPGDSEDMLTSMGFQLDAGVTATDVEDISAAFASAVATIVAGDQQLTQADFRLGAAEPPYLLIEVPLSGLGFSGSDSLPQNTAGLLKKFSTDAGRAGRGRNYIPSMARTIVDQVGTVSPGAVTACNADLETFRSGPALATPFAGLVILHGAQSPVGAPSDVSSIVLDGKVATQRRRLRP